jgi:hypothetical protein
MVVVRLRVDERQQLLKAAVRSVAGAALKQ